MPKLAIRHVEHDSVVDFCPVSFVRQEDKLRVSFNLFFDQPWAGNSVHFNFLASDPFHRPNIFMGAWFWYAVVAAPRNSNRCSKHDLSRDMQALRARAVNYST